MGLISNKKTSSNSFTDEEFELAKKLHRALDDAGRLLTGGRYQSWAIKLHRLVERTEEYGRVETVVHWFCDHIKDPGVPKIYSITSFVSRFLQLEELMQRNKGTSVKVRPEVHHLVERLLRLRDWPKGSDQQVAACVQLSWNNYVKFQRRINKLWEELQLQQLENRITPRGETILRALNYARETTFLLAPETFVREWLESENDNVNRWIGWHGDLMRHAFHPSNQRFHRMMQGRIYDYCHTSKRWDQILEELGSDAD